MEGAQILAYAYFNGKLKGIGFGTSFGKKFILKQDDNINQSLYGIKGREVLAGKKIETTSLPVNVSAYQEMLQKYYGTVK